MVSARAKRATANCRQEVCAGVTEQAQGEEHRPCDRVHLHAERNEVSERSTASVESEVVDEVTTESTDKKHNDGLVEDQSEASGERSRFVWW